jgi:lysophospholipase L1-like esterase
MPDTKIMIMEPFLLHTLPDRKTWHEDLDPKIQIIRELAAEYADFYLPLDGIFASYCTGKSTAAEIAGDGVHPSDFGHSIIASEYIKMLGIL